MRHPVLMLAPLIALLIACTPSANAGRDSSRSPAGTAVAAPAVERDTASARLALLHLEDEWTAAHITGNPAALDRILADEYVGITAGGDFWPKAQEIAMTRSGNGKASDPAGSNATQALDSVHVRLYGDVALLTARITEHRSQHAVAVPRHYYYTSAYVWREGRWQAVMGHVSRAAQGDR